jgi:hypothetical protein
MSELTYPSFPKRAFAVAGAVVLVLIVAAIVANESGPSVPGCARAARHVMATQSYSPDLMELNGPGSVPACRGLTAGQFADAVAIAYQAEYGRFLPRVSITHSLPPPSYKALSAQDEARSRR